MEDNKTRQPQNKRSVFLRFLRYAAVTLVSLWLLVLMIASADTDDFLFSLMNVSAPVVFFIIGFWIYSFIYAPYSSIKEPGTKDGRILIHELRDFDTTSKFRIDYSVMGLKRITTVNSNH